jgi:hypothetical protein
LKSANWKGIAELIGIAAIVASLVFVGMQMEQSQKLAFAESALIMGANAIEQGSLQAEHIDVWNRGNADEELTDAEREIYRILFTQSQNQAFYNWIALASIDTGYEGVGPQGLASFLHQNPGARAEWRRRKAETERQRVRVEGVFPDFAAQVETVLRQMDEISNRP